jgi:hypothetical protein
VTQQVLDKRTVDSRRYDIQCAALLLNGATIASVTSVTADQGGMTIGTGSINNVALSYPDGTTAAIGTVIQVSISGGTIPLGSPYLICNVHAVFVTTAGETLDATVQLRLVNTPNV